MRNYWLYFLFFAIVVIFFGIAYISVNKTDLSIDTVDSPTLATWDPSGSDAFADASAGKGTLSISANCVLLIRNQKSILLVWPEPTFWNESSQVIVFVDPDGGRRIELRNGDQIIPGGAGASRKSKFVSPPDPLCKADNIFIVSSLGLVAD